jgi:pimeloyl-ACP methyl ester carboxylesterase
LKNYVAAVDDVATELGRPQVLVGHSMGGFIVQKYLETAEADLVLDQIGQRGRLPSARSMNLLDRPAPV